MSAKEDKTVQDLMNTCDTLETKVSLANRIISLQDEQIAFLEEKCALLERIIKKLGHEDLLS